MPSPRSILSLSAISALLTGCAYAQPDVTRPAVERPSVPRTPTDTPVVRPPGDRSGQTANPRATTAPDAVPATTRDSAPREGNTRPKPVPVAPPEPTIPLPPKLAGYKTSWLGNNFGNYQKWVQKDGHSLAVGADGRCYVGGTWDESQRGVGIYQNGDVVGALTLVSQTNGMVAVDDKYAFGGTAMGVPGADGKPVNKQGLVRCTLDGKPAGFEGGLKFGRGGGNNFLPLGTTWLSGACLSGGDLYIGDLATNQIRVFDEETLKEKRSFPCPTPYRLAATGKTLWVLSRATTYQMNQPAKLTEYTLEGKPTGKTIPEAELTGAQAISAGAPGQLLVGGPRQQVQKYDVSGQTPKLAGSLGQAGGVWSGTPGAMAPDKLYNIWGVGTDAAGNTYVLNRAPAVGGSTDLRAFSPQGKMLWQLSCTQFTDVPDVDPASDGADIYTRDEHFVMDYTKPAGQQATWKGYTLDPKNDDGRLVDKMSPSMFDWGAPLVRRVDGHMLVFLRPGNYLGIYRQGPGETLIPSGLLDLTPNWKKKVGPDSPHFYSWPAAQPKTERWIWRDKNGDGQISKDEFDISPTPHDVIASSTWVDGKGDIWICGAEGGNRGLRHLKLNGFDAVGNPLYDLKDLQPIVLPAEFMRPDKINYNDVRRLIYDDSHDTMYLSGITEEHPKSAHNQSMGTEVLCYDHWSQEGARKLRWRIVLPDDVADQYSFFNAMALAGDRLFCTQRHLSNIFVYDTANGKQLGVITPGPEVGSDIGWIDMPEGTTAFKTKTHGTVVFTEDNFKEKVVYYQIPAH